MSQEMIRLLNALNELKDELGYTQDLLTPGFLKEVIIGSILGHHVHRTKHGPDAYADETEEVCFEYLSCKEGGSFQLDRIHEGNLYRITRNDAFYFALFSAEDSLQAVKIYKVETDVVLNEAKRKIANMSESSKHIGFGQRWTRENGTLVWELE